MDILKKRRFIMGEQALSGLKEIELGEFVSAAYCTKMMADLGAEVIKVEAPDSGDESRRYGPFPNDIPHMEKSGLFLYLNSNKLGITLNIRTRTGRQILLELLKETDIVVENNPPRLMKDLAVDYAVLKEINPRLIMTSITAFGQTGPYKDYKGYDLNAQVNRALGSPYREPLTFQPLQGNYQGAINGAAVTMVALFSRDITGLGQHVDISESQCIASLHGGAAMATFEFTGLRVSRSGHRGQDIMWPYGIFPCKDGNFAIITLEFDHWKKFAKAMGNPGWATKPKYTSIYAMAEDADELEAHLIDWMIDHTKKEIAEICFENELPFQPVNNMKDLSESEQLKARNFFVEIDHPEVGTYPYPGAPAKLSKTPWRIDRHAPLLGEHNKTIYCNRLGYSREELVEMKKAGVI
jgi:crotonobetainyl-CoA:carnitine CoA-transferase CaiB-like acyl-CoA transferase